MIKLSGLVSHNPFKRKIVEQEPEGDEESGRINMDNPVMQKTGWWKENPDLTVGGVLKQGEDHPAYKDAKKEVEKETGKGQEDKPEPKQTKIAADPFADKEAKPKPKTEPKAKISSVNDISAKDLESGDFDTEDDEGNYLGSEGYDTEELMYEEPPDLKGINNKTDSKILKQKFIDSKLYLDMIGARIEDMEDDDYDEEDIEWEQDEFKRFKGIQNNIVKFLKQKSSGGGMMGAMGHRTKGRQGSGMYDAKNYGKENNLVEQVKDEFKQYGFIKQAKSWR